MYVILMSASLIYHLFECVSFLMQIYDLTNGRFLLYETWKHMLLKWNREQCGGAIKKWQHVRNAKLNIYSVYINYKKIKSISHHIKTLLQQLHDSLR